MLNRPRLIGSEIFRHTSLGSMHPLASPKVSAMIDLVGLTSGRVFGLSALK